MNAATSGLPIFPAATSPSVRNANYATLLESYEVGVLPIHDASAGTYTLPVVRFWKLPLSGEATK